MPHDRQEERKYLQISFCLTRLCWLFLIVTAALFSAAGQAFSQNRAIESSVSSQASPTSQQPQNPPTVSPPPPKFVVPLPEADEKLNNLDRLLRSIDLQLSEDQDLVESTEQAKIAGESLSTRAEQALASLRETPAIEELRDMEANWRQQTRTIESQRRPVTQRLVELEKHISQLQTEREQWQVARAQYQQAVGADVLVVRVDDLLARIEQTLALAQKHRQYGLMVQNLLARQQLLASEVLDTIRDTGKKYSDSLLRADKRPLWQLFAGQAAPSYAEQTRSSMSVWFSQAWELTFRQGVVDHALKELCRVYVSKSIECEY